MTAAIEGDEWSAARPCRTLTPGKTQYPFHKRIGGAQGRSERTENLVPTGIRSRTVQPIAQSLYRLSYPAHYLTCGKTIKGKVHPKRGHDSPERELMYSSTLSLTSALDGVGGLRYDPAALTPIKTQYPLYRRLGEPRGRSGRVPKISPPTRIRSPKRPAPKESLYRLSYPGPGTGYTNLHVAVQI